MLVRELIPIICGSIYDNLGSINPTLFDKAYGVVIGAVNAVSKNAPLLDSTGDVFDGLVAQYAELRVIEKGVPILLSKRIPISEISETNSELLDKHILKVTFISTGLEIWVI